MDFLTYKLKGYRTLLINFALAIMPILQLTEFAAIIPPAWVPWYALIVVLINMWLRTISDTKVGKRL